MKFDKNTKRWQTYSRKDGLAHNRVLSIAVDGDVLWIGTQRGLSRYNTRTESFTTYTQYGDSEDILEMVASAKTTDGDSQIEKMEAKPSSFGDRRSDVSETDAYLGPVIGNKRSKKYHHPKSPSAEQIKEENRVHFKKVAEAEAAGYKRAGNFKAY